MSNKFHGSAVSVAVAMAMGLTAPAHGQNATTSNAGGAVPQLNEVIVTAQRVEQRLLDVPISISVLNQRQITQRNIVSAADLAAYTPSLTVDNEFGNEATTFSIRGFSQAIQTAPTVAVYFDDAVAPAGGDVGVSSGNGAGPGDFFDLQNVQVLSGPQGTLFGLNTTGGAVLLVPKMPTSQFGGYAEVSYGNYDLVREQAVVNLPVNDNLRVRLGVDHESQNGYLQNVSGIGPSDFGNIDYTAARLSAVLDITPDISTYLVASYTLSNNNGILPQLFACNPAGSLGAFACPQLANQKTLGTYAVQNDSPNALSYLREFQVIDATTWQATDNMTVKNIFNYGQLRTDETSQLFGTNFYVGSVPISLTDVNPPPGGTTTDQYTFSDELQFHGTALADKLTWQGGGYIERSAPIGGLTAADSENAIYCSNLDELDCTDVLGIAEGEELGYGTALEGDVGAVQESITSIEYNDLAAYGQATYSFTSRLKLTGGLRYTTDWTDANTQLVRYQFFTPDVPTASCVVTGLSVANGCRQSFQQKSDAPTWLIDLQYYLRPDTMTYVKYARGYREGGVDTTAPAPYNTFRPEKLDDYEIGEKSSWEGVVPGSFDVDAFYNKFTEQQVLVGFLSSIEGVSPSSGIVNIGASRIFGAEVDASIRPFKRFDLSANYAYLHTEVLSYAPVPLTPGGLYSTVSFPTTVGGQLPWSPKSRLTVDATYALPLPGNLGDMDVGATYTYTSSNMIAVATETPYGTLPSYSLVNGNLDWNDIAGSHISAELFVTNLTNKLYYTNVTQLYNIYGFEARWLGAPRMYGARVRYSFGKD